MFNIGSNFNLNSRLYLDSRQIADSLEALQNKTNVLYPPGFEVYCKAEKKWYQNTADEGATPIWTERPVPTGGGNANIDDNNIGTDVTYSNQKIESRLSEVNAEVTNVADDLIDMDTRVSYLEEKQLEGAEVDLTGYATKEYVDANEPAKILSESEIITIPANDLQSIFNTETPVEARAIAEDYYQTVINYTLTNYKNKEIIIEFMNNVKKYIPKKQDGQDIYIISEECNDYTIYIIFGVDENDEPNPSKAIIMIYYFNEDTSLITDCVIKEKETRKLNNDFLENNVTITNSLTIGVTNLTDEEKGELSFSQGKNNIASGSYSHAEGLSTTSSNTASHAEGTGTTASGAYSHAEGMSATASGFASHAEGNNTTASNYNTHAEGCYTKAIGHSSHAEGKNTNANGNYSHAEGNYTKASSECQHVQGKYNIEDSTNKYAHIVGNGTADNARSNAHTLDWDGNAWFAGNVTVGADNKQLATQEYVDSVGFTLAKGTEDSPIVLNSLTTGVIYKVVGYYKFIDTSEILSLSKPMYINIFSRNSTSYSYVKLNSTGTNPCGIYVVKLTDGTYTYNSLVRQSQVLTKTNTEEYIPTSDYHPTTKKYVDDNKVTKTSELTNDSNFTTKQYVDDESLNVLQKIYNGKIYKIQLTEDEMNGMWSLNEEEYITINNITQDDINNIMEGDIYYSALLINDYIFIIQGGGNSNGVNGITCYSKYESSSYGYIEYYNYKIGTLTTDNSTVVIKKIKAEKYDFNTKIINKAIINNKLTLDTNKNQHVSNIVDGTEIVLPTVTDYTEIHLYFDATENLTLTYPSNIIWQQGEPTITSGRTYELIFTYTNKWVCEYVEYGADDVEEATDEEINAMLLEIFGGDYSN